MTVTSQQQIRILHVDDEPSITDLTTTFLEREDDQFTVETATSADEGLTVIDDHPPDCVVSDYNMPGMDGLEFLQAVREEYPDLPFILYTGKGSEAVASDAISAGVTDYLQKESGTSHYTVLANRISNAVEATRSAAKAEQRRHRLEQILKTVPGCVTQLDADGQFVFANERAEEVLGLDTDEVTQRAYNDPEWELHKLNGEQIPDEELPFRQVCDAGEPIYNAKHTVTWPDGSEKVLSVNAAPLFDETGTVESVVASLNDITDRRERQRELRLLQQAIDDANVPITLADPSQPDEPLVYVNDAFEETTGYSPEETLGINCRFLQGDDTDPEKTTALREAIDNEEQISVELRNYRKDGTEFWNRLTVTPIYDDDGQFVRYLGTQEDVTERKELEQELGQTRDLMSNMEELADAGAWEYDSETETLMITDGARRLYGLDPETNLTFEEALDAVHTEDRDLLADRFNTCLETGEPYEMEVRLTTADGGQRWIIARGERMEKHGSGGVIRGYVQDITEERRQRMRLEDTAARLEALFDRSPDMIDIHDTDGNILDVNQQLAERTGYAKHELMEMKVWEIDARVTPDEARTLWGDMDPEDRRQVDGVYECRDGSTFPVEVSIRRLDIEDDDLFVAISRDITQQTERERELYTQNERLDEFASVVSHDLRSPLGVAEGHLELAQDTCESDHLAQAADAIERSQALIDDLLALAREGDRVDETEAVGVAEVAESSWQNVETAQATLDAGGPGVIEADRSRLQELLENLYRNAVEHGGEDVTVSIGAMDDGFYVADTGPGIPETEREDVFEAGYSTNEDGTGFGLRIVEQVATAHGWEVAVTESEQGGTRFEITGVEFADR